MPDYFKKKGKRLESSKVKVRITKNSQVSMTIPRIISRMMNLQHGDIIEYVIFQENIIIRKI